jgi:CheY-like chemotaxis protein
MTITLKVNGSKQSVDVDEDTPLLWVLRDVLGLTGTKFGCGLALCGACTVHVDGMPMRSCVTPVGSIGERSVIALTAGALSSERQRSAAAGMDDYIIKPFDAQQLMRSVLRHVQPPGGPQAHQPTVPQGRTTQLHVAWPEIEGIDSEDARERLNNDFELFRSMLKRLLGEFADVALPEQVTDAGELATHAGRMHKLRGSAGLLGAKAIQRLAGEAEAACVGGDVALAGPLAEELASELYRLRQSAEPAFASRQAPAEEVLLQGGDSLEMDALAEFVGLLRQQKLSAMDCFKTLSPQLRGHLRQGDYERVEEHLDNLRFGDAADILEIERD